jgi:hypothetical protein
MTHQEKIDAIREAAIACNEDILKLVLGCRVFVPLVKKHGGKGFGYVVGFNGKSYAIQFCDFPGDGVLGPVYHWKIRNLEILGRDIRISDVCNTIHESQRYHLRDQHKFEAWDAEAPSIGDIILFLWDFEHDNLELQTPETIDFIYNLLKP